MKLKILFAAFAFLALMAKHGIAQENYGDDPEQCRTNLSIYTEYVNQGNYNDALPAWRWCFNNCPASTKNIYIHGVSIMEYKIENETNPNKKQAYIDSLLMVYDRRIEYFGQKETQLGRKGIALLKYRPEELEEAKKIFDETFALAGNSTEYFILGAYFQTAVALLSQEKIDKSEVVELYSKITDALSYQIANDSKESNIEKIKTVQATVEELFVNSSAADCETIISLFEPKFKEAPDDIELARKIVSLLNRGNSNECKLSDLYLKAAEFLYNKEKSSNAAISLAQSYFKRGDNTKAEKFYLEAIDLETDNLRKADINYELALLYFANFKNFVKARQYAKNAIAANPNLGKAYLLIGRCYAAGSSDCGENYFEQKAVNWVIVDQFIKAKNVDPSVEADANELISVYSSRFPTKEEAFWYDITEEGSSYTVGCWINETTTVRFIK